MRVTLINREKLQALGSALVGEFDNLVARIRTGWNVEHNEEGGHGNIHAESVTAGRIVYSGVVHVKINVPITHNLNPPGLMNASILRIEPEATGPPDILITGLQVPQDEEGNILDGRVLIVENFTENGKSIRIAQENSPNGHGSLARNRFRIPWQPLSLNAIAEFVIHPSSFITLIYSAPKSRWLIAGQECDYASAFMAFSTNQHDFALGTSPRAMKTWRLIPEQPDLFILSFARDQIPEDTVRTVVNDGKYTCFLLHAYSTATPDARIYCPGGVRYALHPRESVDIQYIRGGTGGWRVLAKAGQWIDVIYSASNFIASDGATFTVPLAGQNTFKYRLDGDVMTVAFVLGGATIAGPQPLVVGIRVPDGRITARELRVPLTYARDGYGYPPTANLRTLPGDVYIYFYRDAMGTKWWPDVGCHFAGEISFKVREDPAVVVEAHTDVAHTDAVHADAEHSDGAHVDVAHVDTHGDTPHSDASHTDTVHNDAHTDVPHTDSHSDIAHVDGHSDAAHSDFAHVDVHGDTPHQDIAHLDDPHDDVAFNDVSHSDIWHDDWHSDHIENHNDSHNDQAHNDNHYDNPGGPSHRDTDLGSPPSGHWDFHEDTGSGGSHFDNHVDSPTHTDTHGDSGDHVDSHGDVPHSDVAHGDQGHEDDAHDDVLHQDAAFFDSHNDVPHSDGAHTDVHSDAVHTDSHGDVSHTDAHTDVAHNDTGHSDAAHGDSHVDAPHTDTAHIDVPHGDTVHGDSAHQDQGLHTDIAHTDI